MTDGTSKKSKFSWSKNLVKKWFNIKTTKVEEFHADHLVYTHPDTDTGRGAAAAAANQHWRNNLSDGEACAPVNRINPGGRSSDWIPPPETSSQLTPMSMTNYRVFVATWNVGGKSPPIHLNLDDWLHTSPPADIYVLGFQEIVPLNAGNVLGTEDNGPSKKWLALIRRTLNSLPGCCTSAAAAAGYHSPSPCPIVESDADFEGTTRPNASSLYPRRSFQYNTRMQDNELLMMPMPHGRFSVCERVMLDHRPSDYYCSDDDESGTGRESPLCHDAYSPSPIRVPCRYCLVASKQMVGLFLTVWVKNDIREDVGNLKVSCVGRGLMGYLGNKGSISISMSVHQTSFCFVCSHLTSGQKEGDELRRNSDVMEILRKTRFLHGMGLDDDDNNPETILDHDRIIWLGDLNYRIALSYRSAKALVEMQNWRSLLENDQLRKEQRQGHVFGGWKEGRIHFPPTYKYLNNSDRYATHPKDKRRTPAWCDRILWYGRGLHQIAYVRGESRFSDHRPVYSVFLAEVNRCSRMKTNTNTNTSCSLSARIQVEELLPYAHPTYTYTPPPPNFFY